ncbi:hypothetical protein [Butyrivibrio sp. NC2002]|uniref:hypothetical protein n=1 Tax=Butyrivibrio sp. NC2002 TaxID=1410610 RepID=UPI00068B1042|nr:hypothetical protein [Butyrivibrio sp. NC2002]
MNEETKRAVIAGNAVGSTADKVVKQMFGHKAILAPVLQFTVPEFRNYSIEEVIRSIDAESISDNIPVEDIPPEVIDRGTEMSSYTEKTIFYDKHFIVKNPKLSNDIVVMLHIDFEVQNNYKPSSPSYAIIQRAVYYAARELSSQLGDLKDTTNYGDLEKVYSIWVCNNVSDPKLKNTVSLYSIQKEDIIGNTNEPASEHDLMSVIIIRRGTGKQQSNEKIFDYLTSVFEGDIKTLEKYTDVDSEPEIRKEVKNMSGVGESLVIDAMMDNLQHQIEIGLIKDVDTATKAYPELEPVDIQSVFDSFLKKGDND